MTQKFDEYKEAIRQRIEAHFDLNEEEFEAVFEKASLVEMPKGNVLLKEGNVSQYVYFVASGVADVFKKGENLNTVSAGDVLGEMSLVGGSKCSATVIAKTDMSLFRFSKDTFDVLLNRFPRLSNSIILEALSRKLQQNDL